eukprot:2803819-Rhodomonas_salina.2
MSKSLDYSHLPSGVSDAEAGDADANADADVGHVRDDDDDNEDDDDDDDGGGDHRCRAHGDQADSRVAARRDRLRHAASHSQRITLPPLLAHAVCCPKPTPL